MENVLQQKVTPHGNIYQLYEEEQGFCIYAESGGNSAVVRNLTTILPVAEDFFEKIVRNELSCLHLIDAAEDYLVEIYSLDTD